MTTEILTIEVMENLLHYIWKYKLYSPVGLVTTQGLPISVIDPGTHNIDSGPDFFNAKIKIDGAMWAGSIEIHNKASDWKKHKHDNDKAYDSVILHVTGCNDTEICRTNGTPIPQVVLDIPENVKQSIDWLLHRDVSIPCIHQISRVDPVILSSWLNALLSERLERKTCDVLRLLEQYQDDWNEVFYIILTRSFGFGINSDAFELLAKSLPFRYIQKQRNSSSQIEAMLFGQAGMLEAYEPCHYYRLLQQEYKFLKTKYELKASNSISFKNLRTRPANFPYVKIAQLASIWREYDTLFSVILEVEEVGQMKKLFRIHPSSYWDTHYHFKYSSPEKEKILGENALNILLINGVVPLLFAYGKKNKLPEYQERAILFLENIAAETNAIVSAFSKAGIPVQHAGDSQALIQLKREYCEKKKCLYCRIGFQLLKRIAEK